VKAWRRLARAEARLVGEARCVAGVDEAGRGPLAGPVVAAAVVLAPGGSWVGLNDSKVVPPEVRSALYARVLVEARAFAWAVIGSRTIDAMNIRRASLEAMRRAVRRLGVAPDVILVDGLDTVPGVACAQHALVDGDARMLSIAAASVVAKVVRDRIMERLDAVWPRYGFCRHKGYSTPEHLEALRVHGPCRIHRFSYVPVRVQELPFMSGGADAPSDRTEPALPSGSPATIAAGSMPDAGREPDHTPAFATTGSPQPVQSAVELD
jgi:ribonuclease HII